MNLLRKKRVLLPALIILMLIAAYARRISKDKETITGHLENPALDEISGIAASTDHPGIYYVHNDSGDSSRFFAISPEGKLKTTFKFKGEPSLGLGVRDCEDIAVGPGPAKGKSYVYLGDIGDNDASHPYITVYRFDEPAITDNQETKQIEATPLFLKYPDGPRDAESMMVDPVDKLLYIVTKRKASVTVYTTPLAYKAGDTVTLTKQTMLHFSGGLPPFKWITGGDIAKDGGQILLRSYHNVYYWKRPEGEPVWKTMMQKPQKLYYKKEKQGEAIGFNPEGTGYYTTSEGKGEPIYYYQLR